MNDKERAAMQQALEALREYRDTQMISAPRRAIDSLLLALAEQERKAKYDERFERLEKFEQQAEQEPVAYMFEGVLFLPRETTHYMKDHGIPLYAAPVRTKDLTDAHILVLWQETATPDAHRIERFARAVIAADREKNK